MNKTLLKKNEQDHILHVKKNVNRVNPNKLQPPSPYE